MQLLRVARGHMRPVHLDLYSQKRLSQLGHNSVHLHPSLGLHHLKLRTADLRNHSVRHSLLPYLKEMAVRGAPQDLGVISPISTATKWGIGPRNAPPQEEWQSESEQSEAGKLKSTSRIRALYRCGGSARWRSCHGWYVPCQPASRCCFI